MREVETGRLGLAEIAHRAPDADHVIIEPNGQCLLVRQGEALAFSLTADDAGELFVVQDGVKLPSGNVLRVVYVPAVGIESEAAMVKLAAETDPE